MAKNQPGRKSNLQLRSESVKSKGFDEGFKEAKKKLMQYEDEFDELVKHVKENDKASTKSKEELTRYLNEYAKLKNKLNEFFNEESKEVKDFLAEFKGLINKVETEISTHLSVRDVAKDKLAVEVKALKEAKAKLDQKAIESAESNIHAIKKEIAEAGAAYKVALKERHDYFTEYSVIVDHIKKRIDKSQNSARILKSEADRFLGDKTSNLNSIIRIAANPQDLENFANNLRIKAKKRLTEPELIDSFEEFIDSSLLNAFSPNGQFRNALIKLISQSILKTIDKHFSGLLTGGSFNVPFMEKFLPSFQTTSIQSILKERMEGPASLYKEYGKDFAEGAGIMKDITNMSYRSDLKDFGITQKEIGKAFAEMNKQMSSFIYKQSKEFRDEMGSAIVMLEKAGIAASTTTKAFATLGNVFNENGSVSIIKNMAALGKAMNVNDKVIQDLIANSGKLASLNKDKLEKSIIDLSIASQHMNVEVSALLGQISNFQTFEGAAAAAGELNIALGGQFVDSMMLMKDSLDDPTKALFRLKSAFEQSGKSVDALDPAQIKYFASAFKLTEEEFKKVFRGSNIELQNFTNEMKKKAESEKNFQTMMKKSRDIFVEVSNAFFSAFNDDSLELLKSVATQFGKFMIGIAKFIDLFPVAQFVIIGAFVKIGAELMKLSIWASKMGLNNMVGINNVATAAGLGSGNWKDTIKAIGSKAATNLSSLKNIGQAGVIGALVSAVPLLLRVLGGDSLTGSDIGTFLGGVLGSIGGLAFGPIGSAVGGMGVAFIGGGIGEMFSKSPAINDGIVVSRGGAKPEVIPINSDDSIRLIASKPNGAIDQSQNKKSGDSSEVEKLLRMLIDKMDDISKRPIDVELDGKKLSSALYDINRRNAYNR